MNCLELYRRYTMFVNNKSNDGINRQLCVAPMMDWTDRHCRYFHRLLSPSALLFTEMVTAEAICYAEKPESFFEHNPAEHPLALQVGGSEPEKLFKAIRLADEFGFCELNLNVGCPSNRVQSGHFGACLMKKPEVVYDCLMAMREATDKPVSVKCRIGVDDMDTNSGLDHFIQKISKSGITVFYIHARKALLKGLSPKENRNIPPLNYERVCRLAFDNPEKTIILNGGLSNKEDIISKQNEFDGVMLGRSAYKTPFILAELHSYATHEPLPEKHTIAQIMADYADNVIECGGTLHQITRHMLGLFKGEKGAKYWRRQLGELARYQPFNSDLIRETAGFCFSKINKEVA